MTTEISAFTFQKGDILSIPFFINEKPLVQTHDEQNTRCSPVCCISLRAAASMRFRNAELNPNRTAFFASHTKGEVVSIELIHSKKVFVIDEQQKKITQAIVDAQGVFGASRSDITNGEARTGDGILTQNFSLVPTITVADCVPIFLFDIKTKAFGVLHSGWKGTGIAENAINIMKEVWDSKPQDILAVIGPHIHSCCYTVKNDRADYFRTNFTPECIETINGENHLSLAKANIALLERCGVQNILHCTDCTCCDERLGSFRRETATLPENMSLDEKSRHFTVMAAFIEW